MTSEVASRTEPTAHGAATPVGAEADRAPRFAATPEVFRWVCAALGEQAVDDVAWAQALRPPGNAEDFALEVVFVICNSGMQNVVARAIFERCRHSLLGGGSAFDAFKHSGKSRAIDTVWRERVRLYAEFMGAAERGAALEWLATLPWVGPTTKYHLAKNFGLDVAKPDVHLARLAAQVGTTPQKLCEDIAGAVGLRVAAVETVLWRACANGVIDSRRGMLRRTGRVQPQIDEARVDG